VLSRTIVPTLVLYLLANEKHGVGLLARVHARFEHGFERLRAAYGRLLESALAHRRVVLAGFAAFWAGSLALAPILGQDFFPSVDAGLIRFHVIAPPGTRIERTEAIFQEIEEEIHRVVPREELALVLDNIGLPAGGTNLAFGDVSTMGPADGEILIALTKKRSRPSGEYVRVLRERLRKTQPGCTVFFQPADMVTQILNFGLPAPIDVQLTGPNAEKNDELAHAIARRIARIPGAVDVHVHQILNWPELRVNVDRTIASGIGFTQRDVAQSLLVSLSSSAQIAPNYFLNPKNGVNYTLAAQTPQARIASVEALGSEPIATPGARSTQLLENLADVQRGTGAYVVTHHNVQRCFDVYAGVQGRDLAGVARAIDRVLDEQRPELPRGHYVTMRGQVESMRSSFAGLAAGIAFSILLVYLLLVVNFQSWTDAAIILLAEPGALAGVVWGLFVSGTTLSVPALMGAIMSLGVATANSILLLVFANDRRKEGDDALAAAHAAGTTRLRPVIMTALAMLLGMLPMSLGLGEGGEQNAPLGRAVIGGLIVATGSTLFFVPTIYSVLRRKPPVAREVIE
jgi:multidrug efflux pump subunit AcrB